MTIQFVDVPVPYDKFINDVASRVVAMMPQPDEPEYISQNEAFRRFGRRNVERWRKKGKVEPCKRPGKIEYPLARLKQLKATVQDYFD